MSTSVKIEDDSSKATLGDKPPNQQRSLTTQYHQIAMSVGFYFVISISLVFLNKIVMKNFKFDLPLFITWYQQVVALSCIFLLSKLAKRVSLLRSLAIFELKRNVMKDVVPLTVIFVAMVSFNNLCLEYVEVSFYQVARSLTICFSLLLTHTIMHVRTSASAIQASLVVFLGFLLGSMGEVHFSWLGVIFGVTSSFFVALYSIYVKKILPLVDYNEWKLMTYNTTLSIVFLFPVLLISGEIQLLRTIDIVYSVRFWVILTITGIMGYFISVAVFMQIKYTSPLTNTISGTAKACLQTLLAVFIWQNPISRLNATGILLVIFGSFWYSMIRYYEMQSSVRGRT